MTTVDMLQVPVNCPSELEKAYLTSHSWGSFFTDIHPLKPQDEVRYMNTLWGYVIRKYADLAVPQLEYITGKINIIIFKLLN